MDKETDSRNPEGGAPFSEADAVFIHRVFRMELVTLEDLEFILSSPKLRQPLLDSRRLFEALTAGDIDEEISSYLYFYVITRQVLLRAELNDTDLVEYLTMILMELVRREEENRTVRNLPVEEYPEVGMRVLARDEDEKRMIDIQVEVGSYRVVVDGCSYREDIPSNITDFPA
jgi:hypothetical protein